MIYNWHKLFENGLINILDLHNFIMATVTYETLQTESLLTVNFSLISENFKIIDSFIKSFPAFQRRVADI